MENVSSLVKRHIHQSKVLFFLIGLKLTKSQAVKYPYIAKLVFLAVNSYFGVNHVFRTRIRRKTRTDFSI